MTTWRWVTLIGVPVVVLTQVPPSGWHHPRSKDFSFVSGVHAAVEWGGLGRR